MHPDKWCPCTLIDGGPCTPGAVLKELQLGASSTLGADSDDRILGFELMQSRALGGLVLHVGGT